MRRLKEYGNLKRVIVSGGFTFFSEKLRQKLNFDASYANQLAFDEKQLMTGDLIGKIIGSNDKLAILQNFMIEQNLTANEVIAIGDGANDLPMLTAIPFGIAFHAKPIVKQACKIIIDHSSLAAIKPLMG